VEQGEELEHPRRRGQPPGKWVEAAAHRGFLPMGRVEKSGRRRRPPTRWGLQWLAGSYVGVGRKRKLRRKYTRRKRRQGGAQGSAHRGGVRGGGGGRTTAVACSDRGTTLRQLCGQLRTWETARSGRARTRRGEGGVGSAAASPDTGRSKRLLTHMRVSGQCCPRHPTRVWHGATLPLTAGPHTSAFFRIKNTPK
jgi:hypothetical protein